MALRYLFGPVNETYASENLKAQRQRGECLAFGRGAGVDLTLAREETWNSLSQQFPENWQPDFVVLHLPYTSIPEFLWNAPVPLVGLAEDWTLLWHLYRIQLSRCDLLLTDTLGVEMLGKAGLNYVRAANLFGCKPKLLEPFALDQGRPIDILFVGNMNPAVQAERMSWLGRIARLGGRWRVEIHTGVSGLAYRDLLRRSRIVFNRSIRGECNLRVFEAVASGALLFQEAENRETSTYFRDAQEYICYTADNLEQFLEYHLENEDQRLAIAAAAQAKVADFTFDNLWQKALQEIGVFLKANTGRNRRSLDAEGALRARVLQEISTNDPTNPTLESDLLAAVEKNANPGWLFNSLGLIIYRQARFQPDQATALAVKAVEHFSRATHSDPENIMARLNHAEALALCHQIDSAIVAANAALNLLNRAKGQVAGLLDIEHFPPAFDYFRVAWERTGWSNAGDMAAEVEEKQRLMRWRLHSLLGKLTGDLHHFRAAVEIRPDLQPGQAALGKALAKGGDLAVAQRFLQKALEGNPFDCATARAFEQVLNARGQEKDGSELRHERTVFHCVAPGVVPKETWFVGPRESIENLTSIVVVCAADLYHTRLTLESILKNTPSSYELIVVDNGSPEDCQNYLGKMTHCNGPVRFLCIRNPSNRGFAAACNQGLAAASGQFLVILHNDVVVTAGWLEGLLTCIRHDWPNVGLVGPVANQANKQQQIVATYSSLDDLEVFSQQRRRTHGEQAKAVKRLGSFCLLTRRDILDRLGVLDERFGLGLFEDDDLCLRVREAGLRLLIASGIYVHHFGGVSFRALQVDDSLLFQQNLALFKAKWGEERSSGYRLPQEKKVNQGHWSVSDPITPAQISLCMIVKNEEAHLADCLRSVNGLVQEIVVVDTGSTDKTKEIAAQFAAKIHHFAWIDNFAAARNESIGHATKEWIFWLDGDEHLDEANRHRLHNLVSHLGNDNSAFMMKQWSTPDALSGTGIAVDQVRLFRNHPDIRWRYRVHEQIMPAIREMGATVKWTDLLIHHVGYEDPRWRRDKLRRNLNLLFLDQRENPEDPFVLFNLGGTYLDMGQIAEGLPFLRQSLEKAHPQASILRKVYSLLVYGHRSLKQEEEALRLCKEGRNRFPQYGELLFDEGMIHFSRGDLVAAERSFQDLLSLPLDRCYTGVEIGLQTYRARHQLGLLYRQQGRLREAEETWRKALQERADYIPAGLGLAEMYVGHNRLEDLAREVDHLERKQPGSLMVILLRAKLQHARKDPSVVSLLRETCKHYPQSQWPRLLLSSILEEQGLLQETRQILREIVSLDPTNKNVQNRLAQLEKGLRPKKV